MNQVNMTKRGAGLRRNTNGKLFTDENEYLEELEKTEKRKRTERCYLGRFSSGSER